MLLTLLKVTFFFGVVLAAALGAVYLAEHGAPLIIQFNGVEYTLGPVQAAVAAILALFLAWLAVQALRILWAFLRFLAGDRTAIDRYFDRSRERKGYRALAEGMLAVASGEGRAAQAHAQKAAKYLDQPHLTNLLAAQAAETAGDARHAEQVYRTMLTDQRTRFVGIRGLMQQRLAMGDTATALRLAEKAYALKPAHTGMQDVLLDLQTRAHDWKGARTTIKDKRRHGLLPKDVAIRRDAVLALQEASEVLAQGNSISAREAAISANRASPDLVPAAVLAARSYLAQKDPRNAARLLQKTWAVQPHPALAAAYAEIEPDETPAQRLRRFGELIRQNPDHEESRLLQAELALAAEDFPAARRALGDLAETHPTVRSIAIMAAVERGSGADDSVVRAWLARAMNASRGPQWVCDNCHNIMSEWSPVCDSCHGFDTLSWREPPVAARMATAGNGVEMLPLIIGRPAEAGATAPAADTARPETPALRPVPAPEPPPPPPAPEKVAPEVPVVRPGYIPRESDYAPSVTLTHREVPAPAAPKAAAAITPPGDGIDAITGARPTVSGTEPPAPGAASSAAPATTPAPKAGDPPVRPDVEPPEEAAAATAESR
ncbi:MAG TPA: heme biosynthesis HemY N-terminal domain-containing protein [Paracoccus solventivorans]|uniref:heme biosynthesis protein HemY n=1 Tax=Paracoccus solventivorans TaxID=53463 RepID=UPI002CC6ED66|nr:heme biosynthesis HemY N-terminal domain-containing protein [Paracoccus solventivorans]HMM09746.1 heme biosynthesis HemY N-terminal domain-containing protein [Paracoccus solventivorans]